MVVLLISGGGGGIAFALILLHKELFWCLNCLIWNFPLHAFNSFNLVFLTWKLFVFPLEENTRLYRDYSISHFRPNSY